MKRGRYLKRPNHSEIKLGLIVTGLTPRDVARTERANATGKLVPADGPLTVASHVFPSPWANRSAAR